MASERQRLIPCPGLPGAWCAEPRPRKDGAAVWIVRLDDFVVGLPAPSASDLADAGSRSGNDRQAFLARRNALRHLLGGHLAVDPADIVISYDAAGGPRLRAPRADHFVSVSGRGLWAAFALASRPVGIDLEGLQPGGEIPSVVLTTAEREFLGTMPEGLRAEPFLRLWTAKEAYLKALGTGLLRDPAKIGISRKGETGFSVLDGGRPVAGDGTGIVGEIRGEVVVLAWFLARHPGLGATGTRAPRVR